MKSNLLITGSYLKKLFMSQSKVGKLLWCMIVCLCFCGAGYLIHSSYSAWQHSPVSTSITTHPIADLDFPTVTVCPPKGSHTALNYDLMKANDTSLTEKDRENLKKEILKVFIEPSHQEYVRILVAVANLENMKQTLKGFQSVPTPYAGNRGFEISLWDNNGSWNTPGFGEEYETKKYEEDKYYNLFIDIPKNLFAQIGGGTLVIQLEVDTREEEGWQEEVSYWEGSKYKLYTDGKSWTEAEATCQGEGGHLASVLSDGEQEEARAAMGVEKYIWIGATKEGGVWMWPDGSPWGYHNWAGGKGNSGDSSNCVFMHWGLDYKWWDFPCTDTNPFLCQFSPARVLSGNQSVTLEYTAQNPTFPYINFLYHYIANQQLVESWEDKRMTGFRLSWYLKDINGSRLTGTQKMTEDWKLEAQSPGYQEQQLVSMVQLATQARTQSVGWQEVFIRTIKEKAKLTYYTSMCLGSQIKPDHYSLIAGLNIGLNHTTGGVANDEDFLTGFMMFSTMIYCSESVALSQFLHSLLSDQSPRTIIQATVNTIQSGDIMGIMNKKGMSQFYLALNKIFHFKLGKILLATVSSSDIEAMVARDWPFISHYSQEIDQCFNNGNCQGVRDLVNNLGKYNSSLLKHGLSMAYTLIVQVLLVQPTKSASTLPT